MLYPLSVSIAKRVFVPAARPAILSAMAALALYAVTLGGTYIYDDRYIVLADPRIEDIARWMNSGPRTTSTAGPTTFTAR